MNFLKVSGAGTTVVNSLYEYKGEVNGKPHFQSATHEVIFDSYWKMRVIDSVGWDYFGDTTSASPELCSWQRNEGADPVPSVYMETYPDKIEATGAGASGINGIYELGLTASSGVMTTGNLQNGKPRYSDGRYNLAWSGSAWRITDNILGTVKIYYTSADDVDFPLAISTWTVGADGVAPTPIFKEYVPPAFIYNSSVAVKR